MKESSFIKFQTEHSVAVITLNRPDVLNCFNRAMALEVQQALDQCAADSHIRVILLTGNGRAFCAGQDLKEAISPDTDIAEIVRNTYNPVIRKIREIEKPVVCAVNGTAAGAGANISFACDITFAAENASFIQSFANIGLIPDSGGTWFLPRLAGLQRASALTMLAEKISAAEARQMGLIWKVCSSEKLYEEAFATAKKLAAMPTKGLGLTKRAFNKGLANDLFNQLDFEERTQSEAGRTADYNEGVQSFLEKRKPLFIGK